MKAFRFRLQSVARVREHQERAAAQYLALAVRDLALAQSARDEAHAATRRLTYPEGCTDATALLWVQAQAERMAHAVDVHEESVTAAESLVHESRQAWAAAERKCAILQRLEERQRSRWQQDADRAEAAVLDETATVRFRSGVVAP